MVKANKRWLVGSSNSNSITTTVQLFTDKHKFIWSKLKDECVTCKITYLNAYIRAEFAKGVKDRFDIKCFTILFLDTVVIKAARLLARVFN